MMLETEVFLIEDETIRRISIQITEPEELEGELDLHNVGTVYIDGSLYREASCSGHNKWSCFLSALSAVYSLYLGLEAMYKSESYLFLEHAQDREFGRSAHAIFLMEGIL